MNRLLPLAAASVLLLAGCQTAQLYRTEPHPTNPARGAMTGGGSGAVTHEQGHGSGKAAPASGPVGILAAGLTGHYMDEQEASLRHDLRASGVSVRRVGDDIVLEMKSDITFATSSAKLSAPAIRMIGVVARVLSHYDRTLIDVDGFTDTTGTAAFNLKLSQARAEAVADALVVDGINPARISPRGYGETHLKVPTPDNVDQPANRRLDIRIVPHTAES